MSQIERRSSRRRGRLRRPRYGRDRVGVRRRSPPSAERRVREPRATRSLNVVRATSWRGVKQSLILGQSVTLGARDTQRGCRQARRQVASAARLSCEPLVFVAEGRDRRGRARPRPRSPSAAAPMRPALPSALDVVERRDAVRRQDSERPASSALVPLRRRPAPGRDLETEADSSRGRRSGSTYASLPVFVESANDRTSGISRAAGRVRARDGPRPEPGDHRRLAARPGSFAFGYRCPMRSTPRRASTCRSSGRPRRAPARPSRSRRAPSFARARGSPAAGRRTSAGSRSAPW